MHNLDVVHPFVMHNLDVVHPFVMHNLDVVYPFVMHNLDVVYPFVMHNLDVVYPFVMHNTLVYMYPFVNAQFGCYAQQCTPVVWSLCTTLYTSNRVVVYPGFSTSWSEWIFGGNYR